MFAMMSRTEVLDSERRRVELPSPPPSSRLDSSSIGSGWGIASES